MLALISNKIKTTLPCVMIKRIFLALLITSLGWTAKSLAAEKLYPVALMNWMVEGTIHALIVDKSQQRIHVWRIKDGEPSLVESYRCSTGENEGDKWVRGDMRTPEGVYFFCSVIDGRTLPPKYGLWAFTTDYPNFVDRRRGKSGDGIWLHGRDKPLSVKPDSNGCIALENKDLLRISRFIKLQSTPLIVVDKMLMAPRSVIIQQEREVRDFIESWRQAWESKDLNAYMDHYSHNFQSSWLDYNGWKEKKKRLNKRYSNIKVKLSNIHLYRQDGLITAIFAQSYKSDGFHSAGIKVLYITHSDKYAIYAEDYHQPVDDPYPVGSLLARAGVDPRPAAIDENEFRIRLVSTDESDHLAQGETEMPQPSAPSRGGMLEKVAIAKQVENQILLESNDKFVSGSSPERLVTACNLLDETGDERPIFAQDDSLTFVSAASGPANSRLRSIAKIKEISSQSSVVTAAVSSGANSFSNENKVHLDAQFDIAASKGSPSETRIDDRKSVLAFLEKWKEAWEQKDLDRFMKMYHPQFEQGGVTFKTLLKSKRNFFRKYKTIRVQLDRVEIKKEKDKAIVKFIQSFQGDEYSDKGFKSMVLAIDKDKRFQIISENWSPIREHSSNSRSKTTQ